MNKNGLKFIYDTQSITRGGKELYRIIAFRDIQTIGPTIKKGQIGGYVRPGTLSQDGNCWVCEGSIVEEGVYITGDALVSGRSTLKGDVYLANTAFVNRATLTATEGRRIALCAAAKVVNSEITGGANLSGDAFIIGSAIDGFVEMQDDAEIRASKIKVPKGHKISFVNDQKCELKDVEGKGPWTNQDNMKITSLDLYTREPIK